MPHSVPSRANSLLLIAALTGLTDACTTSPPRPPGVTKDRAFISYRPVPRQPGKLRLAVKDLIDMKGEVTTAGSEFIANRGLVAKKDAACMAIAREREDVVIVGRTNLAEFAMGTTGINTYYGTPRNPLSRRMGRYVPGGSSSGSAVAVATGSADVAFGSDTAGSVRVPAACCGVYGLKTTYGLVSLDGVFPLSPKHLDTVGPMAAHVPHLVEGMALLERGFKHKYQQELLRHPAARSLRVGRLRLPGTDRKIDKAIDAALERAGFRVIELSDDFAGRWQKAHKAGSTVALVDGWLSNKKHVGERGVSNLVKAAMLLGDIEYPRHYLAALAERDTWRRTLREVFTKVDLIALPTLKSEPPRLPPFGLPLITGPGVKETGMLRTQNTVAVNLAGNPAIAIPVPVEDRDVPTSLQLVGPRLSEARLLNAARLVESKNR